MRHVRVPRPSHATVVAYVALFVAMGGTATAATGGLFVLGDKNRAGEMSVLERPSGTPLSLRAGSGAASLKVNSARRIPKLNADLLDGAHGATFLRSLCALGQAPTRDFRCTSSYMRHVPVRQPVDNLGRAVSSAPGVGVADCEGNATLGGGFVLGGSAERLDVVRQSAPYTPKFRPLGWRVELLPNPANAGVLNDGSFAYALCLKGAGGGLP